MKSVLNYLFFRRGGKPRGWLSRVLFKRGAVVRPLFKRVVYKKNGRIRASFAVWAAAEAQAGDPLLPRAEEVILRSIVPVSADSRNFYDKPPPAVLLTQDEIVEHLGAVQSGRLLIAISQDDYLQVTAGVQICIQREQAHASARGFSYLHVYPWYQLPRLAHAAEDPDTLIVLTLDGRRVGACRMSLLIKVAERIAATSGASNVVVHHLLGHLPEQLAELVKIAGGGRCIFWLHDFFSLCPNYLLQRNTLAFCSAPPVTSNACMLCVYGDERTAHRSRLREFFESVRVEVASPSLATAEFWKATSGLDFASVKVLPHMTLETVPRQRTAHCRTGRPITVGYLGSLVDHKGWPVFMSLMHQHSGSGVFRFIVVSGKQPRAGEDAWIPVKVTVDSPTAMSDAVAAEDIDMVLHWPSWPETFSLTTFEALAGSAYVITNAGSGNVAATVHETSRGVVLSTIDELFAFFSDGRAEALADQRREVTRGCEILHRHSEMSFSMGLY